MSEKYAPNMTPLYTVGNQILANFFKLESAKNYIAHEIQDLDTGETYIITMQKVSGETPLHQLAKANEKIECLEHAMTQAMELALRDSEHFGGKRTDIAARIKESLHSSVEPGINGEPYQDHPHPGELVE